MPLAVKILTPERTVFEADDVDYIVAPGTEGDVGVLPEHASFASSLKMGIVQIERPSEEQPFAISGGLLEVKADRVQILAQTAEHRDDIDRNRAEEARQRAEERLQAKEGEIDQARAEAALARALNRLHVSSDEE